MTSQRMMPVLLACNHTIVFRGSTPGVGDEIWCQRCREYELVTAAPEKWRIKCHTCQYANEYGSERMPAEVGIGKHRRKVGNGDHIVILYNGSRRVKVYDQRLQLLGALEHETAGEDD